MEDKRNLSPSGRVKSSVVGLPFFGESAGKIIRVCSGLGIFRCKTKKQEKVSQGNSLEVISESVKTDGSATPVQGNSLEVISESSSPIVPESEKPLKGVSSQFKAPVLKEIGKIYALNTDYSGKTARYKDNFKIRSSMAGSSYSVPASNSGESYGNVKTIFIKEDLTLKL